MKKVRTIKISVTTREILIGGSAAHASPAEAKLSLCPACHSRIAEAVDSAVVAWSETDVQTDWEDELKMKKI